MKKWKTKMCIQYTKSAKMGINPHDIAMYKRLNTGSNSFNYCWFHWFPRFRHINFNGLTIYFLQHRVDIKWRQNK